VEQRPGGVSLLGYSSRLRHGKQSRFFFSRTADRASTSLDAATSNIQSDNMVLVHSSSSIDALDVGSLAAPLAPGVDVPMSPTTGDFNIRGINATSLFNVFEGKLAENRYGIILSFLWFYFLFISICLFDLHVYLIYLSI
jgi:hypothetical protein